MSTHEVQRASRGRALEHGHKMAASWAQRGHNLECACTDCGFQMGVNINTSQPYGLALSNRCPGPKDKEAA